jgi:hypothetical protein
MTSKTKRSRSAATEPNAMKRPSPTVPADHAPVEESPQTDPALAGAAETASALNPEVTASDSSTVNEAEAPAPTEASVDTAATAPAEGSSAKSVAPANTLSALDAAAKVLAKAGQAMSCAELIAAMAAKGYWSSPRGRTPAGTLYSGMLRELQTKGDKARFCKSQRGKFRLNSAL